MSASNVVVVVTHDPWLVALSVAISILAAYAARDLSQRVRDSRGRMWLAWLSGCAAVDGIGTWSVHYTGLLALRLPAPGRFVWPLILLSLLLGIAGSGLALLIAGRGEVTWLRSLAGAIVLGGVGISGVHYTAMAALRVPGYVHRDQMSVAAAMAVLVLAFASRTRRHVAVILRGLANPVMHYTAMAAVVFVSAGTAISQSHMINIAALGILDVSVVPIMILIVALLASLANRLERQRALLDYLFEESPQAIALITRDSRVIRVNREFEKLFGYGNEIAGQPLLELIVPDGERETMRNLDDPAIMAMRRSPREGLRRRKDGTFIPVSLVGLLVSGPEAAESDIYAMYTDLSARKAAEEARRTYPRRLIETQENERKHIARELHDEIGQVLTSAIMMLKLSQQLPADEAKTRIAEARALLDDLIGKVRCLALDLRPAVLDHFGLAAALTGFCERFTAQTGVRVLFRDFDTEGRRFTFETETAVYRIVQEALTNVARHARVTEATVTLLAEESVLRVEIEDRGAGFDPQDGRAQSFGLTGMRERANILGGRLIIDSAAGAGTRVVAELPLRAA